MPCHIIFRHHLMLCPQIFKHLKEAWYFMLLRICVLFSLNHLLELSSLFHLPFVLKRARFKVFRALSGEIALRLLTWRIIITPEFLLSQQIYFLSEPQTNSPPHQTGVGRHVSLTEEEGMLLVFGFTSFLPVPLA